MKLKRFVFLLVLVFLPFFLGEMVIRSGLIGIQLKEMVKLNTTWHRSMVLGYWNKYSNEYPWLPFQVRGPRGYASHLFSWDKAPGTFRIACLGGSTTYQGTYPKTIDVVLGNNVEVLNFGAETWTTTESLANYALRGCHAGLDAIIIYHAQNDVWPSHCPIEIDYEPDYSHWRKRLEDPPNSWLTKLPLSFDKIGLVAALRYALARPRDSFHRYAFNNEQKFQGDSTFVSNIENIIAIALHQGTQVFLVTQLHSSKHSTLTYEGDRVLHAVQIFNDSLRKIAKKFASVGSIHLIDAESEAAELEIMMYDSCHFTNEGYQMLGHYVAKKIIMALAEKD